MQPSEGLPLALGAVFRHEGPRDGMQWRAYVTYGASRFDKWFADRTYGSSTAALEEAELWFDRIVATVNEAGQPWPQKKLAALVEEVTAEADARRPRRILVSVYVVLVKGVPGQYRALVSDRGQKTQRKEIAVNFLYIGKEAALVELKKRIKVQLGKLFGEEVATRFMRKHQLAFLPRSFFQDERLELTGLVKQFEDGQK